MMRLAVVVVAVLLGVVCGPAFGTVLYGPLTFDSGNPATQGGAYVTAGPPNGTTNISFAGDNLLFTPTQAGHGVVHDTGFTTKLSTYTVISTGQWSAMDKGRYSLLGYAIPDLGSIGIGVDRGYRFSACLYDETDPLNGGDGRIEEWTSGDGKNQNYFGAGDQTSGDEVSALDMTSLHNLTMAITDTGDNATSTFKYTWEQEVGEFTNVWVVEETFADIRSYAVGEAQALYDSNPFVYNGIVAHVEGLFDSLVTAARSSVGDTGFSYYVFAPDDQLAYTCAWDNTTVTDGAPLQIAGDANGDEKVDAADVSIMAANWGASGATWAMGDFNGDYTVDKEDAKLLAQNWGTGVGGEEAAAVPEPLAGTLLLSLLFAAGVLRPTRATRS